MNRRSQAQRKDISNVSPRHRRNGISGRPFTTVEFDYTEPDGCRAGDVHRLLAVVPDLELLGQNFECYVVSMQDITVEWKGEFFAEFLGGVIANGR